VLGFPEREKRKKKTLQQKTTTKNLRIALLGGYFQSKFIKMASESVLTEQSSGFKMFSF